MHLFIQSFRVETTNGTVVTFADIDGERRTLNFATGTVVVQGPIVVGAAPITTVRLELDIDQPLSENSDGTWTMAPVVVISVTTG